MTERTTILLIDDDPDFVSLNKILLEDRGYRVETAGSGLEGRKMALDIMPDIIVLDVMMETDMAGFETARWLRSEEATCMIPIIMLTAVNQEKKTFKFGPDEGWLPVDEFLEKPVDSRRLLAEIEARAPCDKA